MDLYPLARMTHEPWAIEGMSVPSGYIREPDAPS